MKKTSIVLVILLGLIAMLIPTNATIAATPETKSVNAQQLALVQELDGTSITYGEFLQKVFPDEYNKLLKQFSKENLSFLDSAVIWPKMPAPSEGILSKKALPDEKEKGITIHSDAKIDIIITHVEKKEEDPFAFTGSIYHLGRIWTQYPPISMTYLSVISFLHYWTGSMWQIVDLAFDSGYGVQNAIVGQLYDTTTDGYYYTHGAFTYISPPGGSPSEGILYDYNDYVYLEP